MKNILKNEERDKAERVTRSSNNQRTRADIPGSNRDNQLSNCRNSSGFASKNVFCVWSLKSKKKIVHLMPTPSGRRIIQSLHSLIFFFMNLLRSCGELCSIASRFKFVNKDLPQPQADFDVKNVHQIQQLLGHDVAFHEFSSENEAIAFMIIMYAFVFVCAVLFSLQYLIFASRRLVAEEYSWIPIELPGGNHNPLRPSSGRASPWVMNAISTKVWKNHGGPSGGTLYPTIVFDDTPQGQWNIDQLGKQIQINIQQIFLYWKLICKRTKNENEASSLSRNAHFFLCGKCSNKVKPVSWAGTFWNYFGMCQALHMQCWKSCWKIKNITKVLLHVSQMWTQAEEHHRTYLKHHCEKIQMMKSAFFTKWRSMGSKTWSSGGIRTKCVVSSTMTTPSQWNTNTLGQIMEKIIKQHLHAFARQVCRLTQKDAVPRLP